MTIGWISFLRPSAIGTESTFSIKLVLFMEFFILLSIYLQCWLFCATCPGLLSGLSSPFICLFFHQCHAALISVALFYVFRSDSVNSPTLLFPSILSWLFWVLGFCISILESTCQYPQSNSPLLMGLHWLYRSSWEGQTSSQDWIFLTWKWNILPFNWVFIVSFHQSCGVLLNIDLVHISVKVYSQVFHFGGC